ncbi:hypothetical protein RBWH47_05746 [Rhodopirellula baltica WH47]|uniref:Uncharacterized protein n=1 Tax=Rhodopirellula baltica WH47 TaxID=991778 RepID=F2AYF0_RHOBT|nr:hypothetical protein RBWH47_05746 [Rhodopirellula baltica WH47]
MGGNENGQAKNESKLPQKFDSDHDGGCPTGNNGPSETKCLHHCHAELG